MAQVSVTDALNTIWSIIVSYIGIIFIIIFVIILLIIGGVWKPSFGIFSPSLIIFIIVIVLLFFIPQFISFPDYLKVVPDSFKYWELPEAAKDALQLIGLPREWGFVPAIIYLFILPFAAIFALFWAFLDMLGILPQPNIKRILALIVAFLTIPLGWFVKMVWVLFAFMGLWSIVAFVAMFVIGVFFRGAGIAAREYSTLTAYSKNKKDAEKFEAYAEGRINDLMRKGVDAQSIRSLREVKDELCGDIRSGGANYDGAKSQFSKIIDKASK
jgi:hypothetical protein